MQSAKSQRSSRGIAVSDTVGEVRIGGPQVPHGREIPPQIGSLRWGLGDFGLGHRLRQQYPAD